LKFDEHWDDLVHDALGGLAGIWGFLQLTIRHLQKYGVGYQALRRYEDHAKQQLKNPYRIPASCFKFDRYYDMYTLTCVAVSILLHPELRWVCLEVLGSPEAVH
jgi:hypothetical protein